MLIGNLSIFSFSVGFSENQSVWFSETPREKTNRYVSYKQNRPIYFMEESVLVGTKPLVDSIRHFSGTRVAYFPYNNCESVVSFNNVTIPPFAFAKLVFRVAFV